MQRQRLPTASSAPLLQKVRPRRLPEEEVSRTDPVLPETVPLLAEASHLVQASALV